MDTGSASTSKRKREDNKAPGVPTSNVQNKWITPSFDAASPEKKKPKSMIKVSATAAPSFRMKDAPTTPKPLAVATASPTLGGGPKFPAFKPPAAASSSSSTNNADTPGRGAALSSLQHRFGPPKQPNPSTPIKKEVKPLLPPAFPFTASSTTKTAPRASTSSKPLDQTPLTTLLATITAPIAASSSSDGHPSSDDAHAQARTSIAIQARELMFKAEEQESMLGVEDEMDEMLVGLNVSPEKPDRRGKRRGFIRNGLAERASHLITRAQNDFSLWSHDLASSLSNTPDIRTYTAPRQRKPVKPIPPDLRLVITETLTPFHTKDFARPYRMTGPPPSYCLARCKIKDTDVEDLLVLFSFASTPGHGYPVQSISSPRGLEEGAEVLVWKPWIDVDLDHHIPSKPEAPEPVDDDIKLIPRPGTIEQDDNGDPFMEDIDTRPTTPTNENDRKMVKAKMLSLLEERGETSARRRAMLCSRFLVKR
ncbi:hypothetical protein FRC04_004027 [Tulasnella sp. 424]|nr:hypothetical protein FRC04_004027 [Tulasnella sp. 424]KAG8970625.1 hypothetical protein FRC05_000561 [Tulasnella sp. 425]